MQLVKIISIFCTFFVILCNAQEFDSDSSIFHDGYRGIEVFDSTDKNGELIIIHKYDVNKNGKLDTIKVKIPEVVNINGVDINESSTEDLTPYLANKKLIKGNKDVHGNDIYKEEFYEIQLDIQEKYLFVVRLYGISKNEKWEKEDNPRVKFDWSVDVAAEDKYKNFVISAGIANPTQRTWNYHLKIANKKLVLTKIVEQVQNYKDCTYRFKKGFEIKMIDTANNPTDKALNKCKEQRLDSY